MLGNIIKREGYNKLHSIFNNNMALCSFQIQPLKIVRLLHATNVQVQELANQIARPLAVAMEVTQLLIVISLKLQVYNSAQV